MKIEVRGLATKLGVQVAGIPEADIPGRIVERLLSLADAAGGDAPLPVAPSREIVRDLQGLTGNEQTLRIHQHRDDLLAQADAWKALGAKKDGRVTAWGELHDLLLNADEGAEKAEVQAQVAGIRSGRRLLEDPDPVGPLVTRLAASLRARYTAARDAYDLARSAALGTLESDELWTKLHAAQREVLLAAAALDGEPAAGIETTQKLLAALAATSPREWEDRVDALPARVAKAREQAAKVLEPAAVRITPPAAMIRTTEDLDRYLADLRASIEAKLGDGPVVL